MNVIIIFIYDNFLLGISSFESRGLLVVAEDFLGDFLVGVFVEVISSSWLSSFLLLAMSSSLYHLPSLLSSSLASWLLSSEQCFTLLDFKLTTNWDSQQTNQSPRELSRSCSLPIFLSLLQISSAKVLKGLCFQHSSPNCSKTNIFRIDLVLF